VPAALKTLGRAAELVSAALFFAMFVLMVAGVVARYGFNAPIVWIDETVLLLFLWTIFWTGAFVVREREMVVFDLLFAVISPRARRVLAFVASGAVGLLFLVALPYCYSYIAFLWREKTSVLEVRLDLLYMCFPLFLAAAAIRLLLHAWRLTRPQWREQV
jgi:TRAP-type C4-dicarboxylate transport system permease small subunit